MNLQPPISLSDLQKNLEKQSGIVNLSRCDRGHVLWFSKPTRLIAILSFTMALFGLLYVVALAVLSRKLGIGGITLLFLPAIAILLALIRKFSRHRRFLLLDDGKLAYLERHPEGDRVIQEVGRADIYSVSSEHASPSGKLDPFYPMYPEILVCAEPRNLVIKAPRRLRRLEMELVLSVLNDFTIGML